MKKILLIICDGLADRPISELGGKTPLEVALTPHLDLMASKGRCGVVDVLGNGKAPASDIAHLSLFGYNLKTEYSSRGPIEALGIGLICKPEDIALRANFCTVAEDLRIIDRHAGRITDVQELVDMLTLYTIEDVKFILKSGTGHRCALVVRGPGLSDEITDGDPMKNGLYVNLVSPLDNSKEASRTAIFINKYVEHCFEILKAAPLNRLRLKKKQLPANYLLVRGAGSFLKVPSFKEKYGMKGCCIAGGGLYKGLGRFIGLDVLEVKGATGLDDTDIGAKIDAALEAVSTYDFIFVHIKGADCFGEDGDFKGKTKFIERIDLAMEKVLQTDIVVALTADHATPCTLKAHSGDPVPLVVCHKSIPSDSVNLFSEKACSEGYLGKIYGKKLMEVLLKV